MIFEKYSIDLYPKLVPKNSILPKTDLGIVLSSVDLYGLASYDTYISIGTLNCYSLLEDSICYNIKKLDFIGKIISQRIITKYIKEIDMDLFFENSFQLSITMIVESNVNSSSSCFLRK